MTHRELQQQYYETADENPAGRAVAIGALVAAGAAVLGGFVLTRFVYPSQRSACADSTNCAANTTASVGEILVMGGLEVAAVTVGAAVGTKQNGLLGGIIGGVMGGVVGVVPAFIGTMMITGDTGAGPQA
jgi:hypothetical protein